MRACADVIDGADVKYVEAKAAYLGLFLRKLAAYEPALADAIKAMVVDPMGLGHPDIRRVGTEAFSW